ncbi:hypothetical protein M0R45_035123 [Rubus argutus]|uniref:Uncharacterized protein n=1 Tax=Rubus argutus TaxID=59490 RepID=A0AAW1VVZ8_RUBAR
MAQVERTGDGLGTELIGDLQKAASELLGRTAAWLGGGSGNSSTAGISVFERRRGSGRHQWHGYEDRQRWSIWIEYCGCGNGGRACWFWFGLGKHGTDRPWCTGLIVLFAGSVRKGRQKARPGDGWGFSWWL